MRRQTVLGLALGLGAVAILVAVATAGATHPRPAGASPLRVSLVPAYKPCTASNRTHGPPLASPSCNPPAQASDFLTVGTPDANGAAAKSSGLMKFAVHAGAPGPPSDTDVRLTLEIADVRCKASTTACGNANATGGPDYTGELQGNAMVRITDHFNATSPGGGTDPATVIDIPVPVNANCTNTADTSIGASCAIDTSTQPMIPDPCGCEGKRMVVGITQIVVSDGGSDGVVATTPNTVFMRQGIFIP